MTDPKWYGGNNPNSANYDPNLPPGTNKWDEEEAMGDGEDREKSEREDYERECEESVRNDFDGGDYGERFD